MLPKKLSTYELSIHRPILIRVYPRKWGWLDLPHSNSILSNSHSLSRSIQGFLLLQTNTLALLLQAARKHELSINCFICK